MEERGACSRLDKGRSLYPLGKGRSLYPVGKRGGACIRWKKVEPESVRKGAALVSALKGVALVSAWKRGRACIRLEKGRGVHLLGKGQCVHPIGKKGRSLYRLENGVAHVSAGKCVELVSAWDGGRRLCPLGRGQSLYLLRTGRSLYPLGKRRGFLHPLRKGQSLYPLRKAVEFLSDWTGAGRVFA